WAHQKKARHKGRAEKPLNAWSIQQAPLREEKAGGRGLPGIKFSIKHKELQALAISCIKPRGILGASF
ncbi:hypothetical protein, partial [Acidovorax temperans]|uniref:hypothetical protein n=1 Tax=Acidovorax temperans TaxID=80878 RepID=UPI000AFCAB82